MYFILYLLLLIIIIIHEKEVFTLILVVDSQIAEACPKIRNFVNTDCRLGFE